MSSLEKKLPINDEFLHRPRGPLNPMASSARWDLQCRCSGTRYVTLYKI